MPRKNKKVRWAKAHRAPGSKFFSKNYIDSVENLDDPDYIDEEDSCSVSDSEGWTVSLQKYGITDLGALSDSEGEREDQGYVAKDNLDHIDHGKKRKASDVQSCEMASAATVRFGQDSELNLSRGSGLPAPPHPHPQTFTHTAATLDLLMLSSSPPTKANSRAVFYHETSHPYSSTSSSSLSCPPKA
ncbi:hypothetical protein EV424DRAFT_1540472 [Suillus variegatus]|nr:hypothetical protein EV424DRAFT_1540472 [Suillus variegatus]